jgi:ATP-dependent Lon protease|tara:strand:+ start:7898 stop:10282 length:2385 start_codon:yes stop_codon:yes gene_type:complete
VDIDQEGEIILPDGSPGRSVVLPSEVLPANLHILPQESRPFFPGQAIPLLMSADAWLPTLQAVKERDNNVVGLIAARDRPQDMPNADDLYDIGTACRIHRVNQAEGQIQILLEGLQRFRVRRWISAEMPLHAGVRYLHQPAPTDASEEKAYAVAIINTIKELIPLNPLFGEELKIFLARSNPNEPSLLADFAAALTTASKESLQEVLETLPLLSRMEKVLELLHREVQIAKAQMDIREHVEAEIQTHQREAFLREQLKFIQKELGITKDDKTAEADEFSARLEGKKVPATAQAKIDEELNKLRLLELGSPEYGVTRNYLDWLTTLPWGVTSVDCTDIEAAAKVLDTHHEGLDEVKERIIEFIGLGIMKGDVAGSIVCLVGPPGVGKTSLGRSVAEALGRQFYRFSVGGMRDEAEIKGHRRTYIGALPGKLIQALKDTGVSNPVIMLDEVDKIGASYQGDPASALLEVLDPEQNSAFHDHYLDTNVDLSRVLFICTANQLDTIPAPLLDRMELIRLGGYLDREKIAIARKHLLPRQLKRAGLTRNSLRLNAKALRNVVEGYSREVGVRRLDNALATLVRKAALQILKGADTPVKVTPEDIPEYLGPPPYVKEPLQTGIGVVTGLAWTTLGGTTLPVEATKVHDRNPGMKLTGQLGSVMKESANIAYSYVAGNATRHAADSDFFSQANLHLHVPAGATPKDGPSAGITMAAALLSLAVDKPPRRGFTMTGELTLTGKVYPVGGIREKLIAAKRQKFRQVLLPEANRRDVDELPEHILTGITVHFVANFDDVVAHLF